MKDFVQRHDYPLRGKFHSLEDVTENERWENYLGSYCSNLGGKWVTKWGKGSKNGTRMNLGDPTIEILSQSVYCTVDGKINKNSNLTLNN